MRAATNTLRHLNQQRLVMLVLHVLRTNKLDGPRDRSWVACLEQACHTKPCKTVPPSRQAVDRSGGTRRLCRRRTARPALSVIVCGSRTRHPASDAAALLAAAGCPPLVAVTSLSPVALGPLQLTAAPVATAALPSAEAAAVLSPTAAMHLFWKLRSLSQRAPSV